MTTLFVTLAINEEAIHQDYINSSLQLIDSVLKHTNHSILIVTDEPDKYIPTERVMTRHLADITDEPILSAGVFNMHLKRIPIRLGYELGYDRVIFCDADVRFDSWDVSELPDVDIMYKAGSSTLEGLKEHPSAKQWINQKLTEMGDLWYPELGKSPHICEVIVLFKREKLGKFLDFWDKIVSNYENPYTYYDGFYFGVCITHSGMSSFNLQYKPVGIKFLDRIKVYHQGKELNLAKT